MVGVYSLVCEPVLGGSYRAARLVQFCEQLMSHGGEHWLEGLTALSVPVARAKLQTLPGIGPKVADCICLFGLGDHGTVVLDTHCRQICSRAGLPWAVERLCNKAARAATDPKYKVTVSDADQRNIDSHFTNLPCCCGSSF